MINLSRWALQGFSSAKELEAVGLERLKKELQSKGLICGGTLEERAARLFLLKYVLLHLLRVRQFRSWPAPTPRGWLTEALRSTRAEIPPLKL